MFGWRDRKKTIIRAIALGTLVGVLSCGSPPPPPAPPPPPSTGNNTGGISYGGSCGAIGGGIPLRSDNSPYYSTLIPANYGASYGDYMSLQLFYMNYGYADTFVKNIVGSGNMYLPTLTSLESFPSPNQQVTFCASSASLQGGSPTPGTLNAQNLSIQITLNGIIQVPLYSPYSGYPGGFSPGSGYGNMGQEEVMINIGGAGDCGAYLSQGRIVGCVDVIIGPQQSGSVLRYYAE